jgi:arginine deiminase
MCELMILDDTSLDVEKEKDHNQPSSSSTSLKKTLAQMGDIMQKIINEIKEGGVQLIDHTTSLLHVIATNVRGIRLSKVNEFMHLDMVFHFVNDGLFNSLHRMKDWHETILEHGNIRQKKVHE